MKRFVLALAPWLALGVACSSSTTVVTSDSGVDAGHKKTPDAGKKLDASDASETSVVMTSDAKPDVINDPKDCVAPGTLSNPQGVGGYCSPAGGQCAHAVTGGMASICTGDIGAAAHEWFCTVTCSSNTDCGSGGATCIQGVLAQVCVPSTCLAFVGDSGVTEGGTDAAADAKMSDAGKSDAPADAKGDAPEDAKHD